MQSTPTEIYEKSIEINDIDENRQTLKSNNDHREPDRPEIEKVNKRFQNKVIAFGRHAKIKKTNPGTHNLRGDRNINEITIKIDGIATQINDTAIIIDEIAIHIDKTP